MYKRQYYDWAVGAENNGDLTSAMQEGFVKLMVGDIDVYKRQGTGIRGYQESGL